jgi:hypothetical protein
LLSLATLCSIAFGVLFPLFAVAGLAWISARPEIVVAGLVATLVLILAYFLDELVHYRILSNKLMNDVHEWGAERWIVVADVIFVAERRNDDLRHRLPLRPPSSEKERFLPWFSVDRRSRSICRVPIRGHAAARNCSSR